MFYRGLALFAFLGLVAIGIHLSANRQVNVAVIEDEDMNTPVVKRRRAPGSRTPASTSSQNHVIANVEKPLFSTSEVGQNIFSNKEEIEEHQNERGNASSSYGEQNQPESAPRFARRSSSGSRSSSSSSSSKATTNGQKKSGGISLPAGSVFMSSVPPLKVIPPSSAPTTENNSSSSGNVARETLNCSSNIGSGTFSYAFSVTLNCTSAASIRYCISEDTCCDPSTGTLYSGAIPINMGAGNFCLSFYGESSNGTDSDIVNNLYTLNPAVPDLQVAHQKRFFQSTELDGEFNLTSTEFGDPSFSIGVLNLKSHDPGPSGLAWDCQKITADYGTLAAPAPLYVLNDLTADTFTSGTQIDLFLRSLNLTYGINYITSYVKNNNFVEPVVACSTTPVMLEDFAHFDYLPSFAVPGTSEVTEFSGGFTHLGFFEPETTLYRGPAGSSSESVSGQEIETNLFEIFY